METIEVYRIEDENGKGPFYDIYDSFIPTSILRPMWNKLPFPCEDFDGFDFKDSKGFCEKNLNQFHWNCFFAFPSYEVFKEFVGDREVEIAEYVTTYKTSNYVISKSGNQVLFTKTY